MLKPIKPKLSVENIKERTVTKKNDKTPYYLATRTHFSPKSAIDGSTLRSRNSRGLLPLPLGNPPITIVEPSTPHLHKLHEHNIKQMTIAIININLLQSLTSGCRKSQ